MKHYDIVIIGAGLVGASLACALYAKTKQSNYTKNTNLRIAVIDKNSLSENSDSNIDSRAIALSWSSVQILEKIGVWPTLFSAADHSRNIVEQHAINTVHVCEQGHFGASRIKADDFALPFLGAVINADRLNFCLQQYLLETGNVSQGNEEQKSENFNIEFFSNTEIKRLVQNEMSWELELSDGTILQASLMVGADGSDSFLRRMQGVELKTEPHLETAIVVNVALQESHAGIAYERFLKSGSIAMLPFGENRVKCVWLMPKEYSQSLMAKEGKLFLEDLQNNFGYRLGVFTKLGKRTCYPIRPSAAESIYGKGWVLIGNAANTLSPVAAQGFNLGLRDAYILAEEIIKLGNDLSKLQHIDFLQTYARQRLEDQTLVKHFTQQLGKASLKRPLGILACEFINPVKFWLGNLSLGKRYHFA